MHGLRVLLVSPYFPPQNAVASLRVHSFARALAEAGEAVTVLTAAKRDDQRGLVLPHDGMDVVEIDYRVPRFFERLRRRHKRGGESSPGNGKRPVRGGRRFGAMKRLRDRRGVYSSVRMPDLTDYWVKPAVRWCRTAASTQPFDVVISSCGPYTAHLVALAAKREGLARAWIADFRDLWTDNHAFPGVFPLTLRERALERRCLVAADLLTTVSGPLQGTLERKCEAPVEVIYNGFDAEAAAALPAERIFPDDDLLRLAYTGALYPPNQDPSPLFRAIASLKDERPDVADRLRIVVAGHGCAAWRELAEPFGVDASIDVRGTVSRDDALRMQRDAAALLLVDWPRPDEGVLTGKLFEYLNAEPPILIIGPCRATPIADAVARARRGRHLGDSVDSIRQALIDLADRPESLRQGPDRAYICGLSRQEQGRRLVEHVRRLGSAAPRV